MAKTPAGTDMRLSAQDLAAFYDQLARCLKTGLPAGRTLRELAAGAGSPRLRRALEEAMVEVESGEPVGETLGKHPGLFPAGETAYLGIAEAAGRLPAACEELAGQHRARHRRGVRLRAKMAYPLALLTFAVAALPLRLAVMGDLAAYGRAVLPPLALLGAVLAGVPVALRAPAIEARLLAVGWRLPLTRPWLTQRALAQLARSLGHGYAAGLAPDRALRLAAGALAAGPLKKACHAAAGRLGRGGELAEALSAHPAAFPARLREAVRTGELTGTLDQALLAAADALDAAADQAAERALRFATGALTALVIGLVGWQVLAMALAQIRQVQEQLGI